MKPDGVQWGLMEPYEPLWSIMEPYEDSWGHMKPDGDVWSTMEPYEANWGHTNCCMSMFFNGSMRPNVLCSYISVFKLQKTRTNR